MRKGKERHDGEAYPIVKICSAFGFVFQEIDNAERQHYNQRTVENNSVSFYCVHAIQFSSTTLKSLGIYLSNSCLRFTMKKPIQAQMAKQLRTTTVVLDKETT